MSSNVIHLKNRVMNDEEIQALLQKCPVGRIGTTDDKGIPYITPINYAYDSGKRRIYIHHAAKGGKLLDNLKWNNRVCFETEETGIVVNVSPSSHICDGDQIYRSLICFGRMSVADNEEKVRGLRLLGNKYFSRSGFEQKVEFQQAKLDRLVVLVIDIDTINGKSREAKE